MFRANIEYYSNITNKWIAIDRNFYSNREATRFIDFIKTGYSIFNRGLEYRIKGSL